MWRWRIARGPSPSARQARKLEKQAWALYTHAQRLAGETTDFPAPAVPPAQPGSLNTALAARLWCAFRTALAIELRPNQLMAALGLLQGTAVEFDTGEGKTYSLAFAASLMALQGQRVHIFTANPYLAARDYDSLLPLYHHLGLDAACISISEAPASRKNYQAAIVHGSAQDFAFDCLQRRILQRPCEDDTALYRRADAALVDEMDMVLIDECTTPFILSEQDLAPNEKLIKFAVSTARALPEDAITIDERSRSLSFNEDAYKILEFYAERHGYLHVLQSEALYQDKLHLVHWTHVAATALWLIQRDRDYIVENGERIVLINPATHRREPGKRWQNGLHQVIEYLEEVPIQPDNQEKARITMQNLLRGYPHLAGASATLQECSEEFAELYRLPVLTVPRHRAPARADRPWHWVTDRAARQRWLAREVHERLNRGQPVLVGVNSVHEAREVAAVLDGEALSPRVLTASEQDREAELIAGAGEAGKLTVATGVAGRGTHIPLSESACQAGGLAVVLASAGVDPRIDRQFRGRCARQGQPGESLGFIGPDVEVMARFDEPPFVDFLTSVGVGDDDCLVHPRVDEHLMQAQTKSVAQLQEMRRTVTRLNNLMEHHYQLFAQLREQWLAYDGTIEQLSALVTPAVEHDLARFSPNGQAPTPDLWQKIGPWFAHKWGLLLRTPVYTHSFTRLVCDTRKQVLQVLHTIPADTLREAAMARLDEAWSAHSEWLTRGWAASALLGYAYREPFVVYQIQCDRALFRMFEQLRCDLPRTLGLITKCDTMG